jgi:23S rRNA pseudouridine1911/1915/1917 synthase
MEIKILKETPDYLIISKPIGISVHPGAGERVETITDWLQEKYPEIKKLPWKTTERIGIVHRLDKDTSGILLLAKTPEALDFFQDQFKERSIEKHYQTLVFGKPPKEKGSVNALIRRDPKDRERQKVEFIDFGLDESERKDSATDYETIKTYNYKGQILTLLDVKLNTGRKHQIRVHMKYELCPVMGDQKYLSKPSKRLSKELGLDRQFLHAVSLKFKSYPDGEDIGVKDSLPVDLTKILEKIS